MELTGTRPEQVNDTVLVVDDLETNRLLLKGMLQHLGFEVLLADNGARGVALFRQHSPWIVLIDVLMPVMDGIETAKQIRAMCGDRFVPILFVTSSDDEQLMERCIEAGADDFFRRPISLGALKAKLLSMQRIRRLYSRVQQLHSLLQRDEEIAEQLLRGAIEGDNSALNRIRSLKRPAETFCGDVQLSAFRPNGNLNVLLGDFTGHGLASVVGALPLSETFRAMTQKGFSGDEILRQINLKLMKLLPTGKFLAATLVTLDAEAGQLYVWNCGMPEVLVISPRDGDIRHRISSADPPLGIMTDFEPTGVDVLPVASSDRILLYSDGLVEARNPVGEMFGDDRLIETVVKAAHSGELAAHLMQALDDFMDGCLQDDDVSLLEIPCNIRAKGGNQGRVVVNQDSPELVFDRDSWLWSLELRGASLQRVNPVPMMLSQLQEMQGNAAHWQSLFTILTELYVNALDHGVLQLKSEMKSTPQGFARYFSSREAKLNHLTEGFIRIQLTYTALEGGGRLLVRMHDSGKGFDFQRWLAEADRTEAGYGDGLAGRGIRLVVALCESIEYSHGGAAVEVGFSWRDDQPPE
ncbi:fused response regulator/phosphatase [Marinobacterium arenosum]|uniref:fused response regulator/phosphatase n=1 Tax=Marinobacterium arenosum TaxID=2862496 RepID=UPI001C96A4D2|nr:fused response regulator/phosphatase [Marinobacterium arenosum]MBY4678010.1 fused response regulator/phosphatase [Marinobacterium arenosum]